MKLQWTICSGIKGSACPKSPGRMKEDVEAVWLVSFQIRLGLNPTSGAFFFLHSRLIARTVDMRYHDHLGKASIPGGLGQS